MRAFATSFAKFLLYAITLPYRFRQYINRNLENSRMEFLDPINLVLLVAGTILLVLIFLLKGDSD